MKTYQEYYEEWLLSTESRDLAFDEWLMVQLARKEKQMVDKACEWLKNWMLSSKWHTMEESLEMLRKAMEE